MTLYEFGQIFGIFITIIGFFAYLPKKRGTILLIKATTDGLSTIQQSIIGAYTGALITAIAVFRGFVFANRGQKKWASHKFWLWFFVVVIGSTPIFTWSGAGSLLPMAGSVIMVFGFYSLSPLKLRVCALLGHTLWLVYTIICVNIGSIFSCSVYITAAIIGLIRDIRAKKTPKQTHIRKEDY